MITYVNTVFVANDYSKNTLAGTAGNAITTITTSDAGKFVVMDVDTDKIAANTANRIKIGYVTDKTVSVKGTTVPVIKWSNIINKADLKALNFSKASAENGAIQNSEDAVTIDLSNLDSAILAKFANGGKRIVVRLTFKDLPTRYRKWTESYEYITPAGDVSSTANILTYKRALATGIMDMINGEAKRARVVATKDITTSNTAKVILTAMPYDDDDTVETLNWADKVRFNANVYWTDPAAEGWESLNKHFPTGVTITKVPGTTNPANAKLVRDREAQAMGYEGILNRGMGTWPIIKPEMNTKLDVDYGALTLEFENMYRAADDIFRKTKQTVEVYGGYGNAGTEQSVSMKYAFAGLKTFLETFAAAVKNY